MPRPDPLSLRPAVMRLFVPALLLILATASSVVRAETINPRQVLAGFWNVEWRESTTGRVQDRARLRVVWQNGGFSIEGCHEFYRMAATGAGKRKGDCGFIYFRNRKVSFSPADGKVRVQEALHVLGAFGGQSEFTFSDSHTARGTWAYKSTKGTVTWQRSRAQAKRVAYHSEIHSEVGSSGGRGLAKVTYNEAWRNVTQRAGRPTMRVEIFGKEHWGERYYNILDADGRLDQNLEAYGRVPIYTDPAPDGSKKRIGTRFYVAVWKAAKPGRKFVLFDGRRIPFDFTVDGHPDLPHLAVVAAATADEARRALPASSIPRNGPFWFRAEYIGGPGADAPAEKTLTVDWGEGSREITLRRPDNFGRFYLAGPFQILTTPPPEANSATGGTGGRR